MDIFKPRPSKRVSATNDIPSLNVCVGPQTGEKWAQAFGSDEVILVYPKVSVEGRVTCRYHHNTTSLHDDWLRSELRALSVSLRFIFCRTLVIKHLLVAPQIPGYGSTWRRRASLKEARLGFIAGCNVSYINRERTTYEAPMACDWDNDSGAREAAIQGGIDFGTRDKSRWRR